MQEGSFRRAVRGHDRLSRELPSSFRALKTAAGRKRGFPESSFSLSLKEKVLVHIAIFLKAMKKPHEIKQ